LVAALGLGIATLRGRPNLFVLPAEESLRLSQDASPWAAHLASAAGGLGLAVALVAATRWLVRTQHWAAALCDDLRPFARALGPGAIVPVALASSIGEEILFRGALVPAMGVVLSSVLFGALHQLRGRSRLSWVGFATVVGLLFAMLFRATGSLVGPILAHALVNGMNLRFLQSGTEPRPSGGRARLGGLLRR
jgi:membrane protease YdiL (CAAX protease family)